MRTTICCFVFLLALLAMPAMAQCPVYDYAVPINTCVTVFYVDFCWTTYICVNNDSGLVDYAVRPHRAPEPVVHVPEEPPNPKPGTVKK